MSGAGDPIDDEDAFLYGTSNLDTSPSHEAARPDNPPSESRAHFHDVDFETEKPDSGAATGATSASAPDASANDEEDEEEEDSDESDIEFIIDPNAPLVPPSRTVSFAPPAPASKPEPAPTEDSLRKEDQPKPLAEPSPLPTAEPAEPEPAPVRPTVDPVMQARAMEETLGPEGPPPTASSTDPELQLDPSGAALHYPPTDSLYDGRTQEEQAQEPPPMTIYQVDIESLPEKPWRRPGAKLSDWFNYGFDEHTWALWCAKKNMMSDSRAALGTEVEAQAPGIPAMPFMPPMEGAQDAFAAMFGPGAMMNMPSMPAWPGMPEDGQANVMAMPPAMPGASWGEMPPHASENESCSPQDGQHDARPSGTDGQEPRHERRGRRGGRRHGGRSGGGARRADDEDEHARSQGSYNDRDTAHGAGDALDYGARPEESRWHRGSPRRTEHDLDDDAYDPEQFGRPPPQHHRDRPSRRERERARHERRSGRGGQKRGPPEGAEDGGDYASKRFHGGRGP
ncbi:cleavage polyadenylation factor subunit fip1 [Malassezia caprae]|uniref:Cleavage polyadenylation factor subunit fip1 n=1 Tax=Malassezia caprae TaxID=1381934 RepID=A0AAF0EC96_9BASI|nr:cleavage polyadenylation factor subunit fip1 [Malassezia caprae]